MRSKLIKIFILLMVIVSMSVLGHFLHGINKKGAMYQELRQLRTTVYLENPS